jgi:hypothetical protein
LWVDVHAPETQVRRSFVAMWRVPTNEDVGNTRRPSEKSGRRSKMVE